MHFPEDVAWQLRGLPVDRKTTVQNLLAEALNDLFAKYGKPEIVPSERQRCRPDLAGAEPGYKAFEAGPRYRATGGAAEIVIDNLDVVETSLVRDLDQIVFPLLAFQVGLHLGLAGLPHVDHRTTAQHGRRQGVSRIVSRRVV